MPSLYGMSDSESLPVRSDSEAVSDSESYSESESGESTVTMTGKSAT